MKRLMYTRLAGVAVTALALTLAGCGGSDNVMEEPPELTAEEKRIMELEEELQAAKDANEDLQAEKEQVEEERDMAEGKLDEQERMEALEDAKALFSVLRQPLAVINAKATLTDDANTVTGVVGDETGRTEQVSIPALKSDEDNKMMFEGENSAEDMFTAMVYDTKADDKMKPFADMLPRVMTSGTLSTTAGYVGGVYTFGTTPDAYDGIDADDFPQKSGKKTYAAGKRTFGGTLDGAPGTYKCSAATDDCEATWTEDGIDLDGAWTFTPEEGAKVVDPDTKYQSYGWWLQKDKDGEIKDAGPVHFTTGFGTTSGVDALEGTAKYMGTAAGKYSIYSGAFSARSEAGHFTAKAELMADFGDETAPGKISGKIDNFVTASGEKDNWTVTLKSTALATGGGGAFGNTARGDTVWKIGDTDSEEMGGYMGRMYGHATGANGVPDEVGGTFDAPFEGGVGQMVGAFAAELAKD